MMRSRGPLVFALAPGLVAASLATLVALFGDRALLAWLNAHPLGPPDLWGGVWEAVSLFGLGLSALLLVLLFGAGASRWIASVGFSFLTVGVTLHVVKQLLQVPRPAAVLASDLLHVFGPVLKGHNSMPSGHAATAFAVVTTLLVAGPAWARARSAALWLLPLAVGVSLSRVVLGAHWASDVAAGALLGWVGGLLAAAMAHRSRAAELLSAPAASGALALALVACGVAMACTQALTPIGSMVRDATAVAAIVLGGMRLTGLRWPAALRGPGAARGLVALLVAVLAARWLAPHAVGPETLPLGWWIAVPMVLLLSYGCRTARVHAELGALHGASRASCLRLVVLHNAALNLVPMRGGELAYPLLARRLIGVPVAEAGASLVWMRLQDAAVLGLLAWLAWVPLPWPARVLTALAWCALLAVGLRQLRRGGASARPGGRWGKVLQLLAAAPRHSAAGWGWCVANWSLKLLAVGAVVARLGGLPLPSGAIGALGGELAGLWPLQAPAGLGSYEAGVWLGAAGIDAAVPVAKLAFAALVAHGLAFGTAMAAAAAALLAARLPRWKPPATREMT